MPKKLLMGNAAFAHAALAAGVRVVAGYPGTPSSELVETVAALHASGAAQDVHVEWSTNEKAALELLAGASMAGARCLFTCKQVGLNVASDPLMSLNYVGTKGGLVLFVADDPGPISSQTEQDTRRFASFAKVPVLDPSSPEEGFEMMGYAFELSERHGTPVIIRPTTRINHASAFFDVPDSYQARALPPEGFQRDSKWIIFPRRAYQAHGEINERLPRMAQEFSETPFNPCERTGDGAVRGIVAGGVSTAYVRDALSSMELPAYRFLHVGTPYPFPTAAVRDFLNGLDEVIVFEELDHVLEDELLKLAGAQHLDVRVHGKLDGTTLARGENSTEDCRARLASFFGVEDAVAAATAAGEGETAVEPPVRPPVLCAGCPHRGSFYAVKKALHKQPAVLCGDIGCYTLGNAKPLDAIDTCLCMGAGLTMAQGFHVAEPGRKCVAFIGDSTFFASGLTGVANAVYNQHDVTFVVLDNSTTAMTGSQPHPGTGATLMGGQSAPLDIEAVLSALGVGLVVKANAFDVDEAVSAAATAIDFAGPSAVIFTGPCIQLVRPDASVTVDEQACTGCSACIKALGCPAMSMTSVQGDPDEAQDAAPDEQVRNVARVMRVDASLCTGCRLCTSTCPFGAIKKGGAPCSTCS